MSRIIRGGGFNGGFGMQTPAPVTSVVKLTEDGEIIRDYVEEVLEPEEESEEFVETVYGEDGEIIQGEAEIIEEPEVPAQSLIEQAEEEAKRIIDDATRKAKGLIAQAKMESKNLKIKAKEEALKEGFDSGVAKIEEAVSSFDAVIQEVQTAQKSFIEDFENTVVSFSIEIANEIMRREIEVDPFALCDMVEHAMHSVREAKWAVVTLSKKLTPLIELLRSELADKHKNIENIDVVGADIDITQANIDTPNGRIELSIITQLDNLVQRFEMIDKE